MSDAKEVLTFEDLAPYLLLKNGNFLYKVPFRGGHACLKVYYGSRSQASRLWKSFENVVFAGQSSYMPKTRLRIERECIDLWRRHGFRVFEVYDDVEVKAPGCPPGGYLLLEFVQRPKLIERMRDERIPADERFALWRRFLAEWGRRHALAIEHREPRLVHENGDGKHVMLLDDGTMLWFDFEMIYRSRRKVQDHVSHEIVQYLWHTHKTVPKEDRERLFAETVAHYPARERLERAYDYFYRHPNPFHRLGRWIDRTVLGRARKETSKYIVARKLREALERA